jgi:PTS system nitrogen regulatory IIA component
MRIAEVLGVDAVRTDWCAADKEAALRVLARMFVDDDPTLDEDEVFRVLSERESLATTGVGSGIAIPHGRLAIDGFHVVMAISPQGVDFGAIDGQRAHIFVAMLAPEEHPAEQLRMLGRFARVLRDANTRERLLAARDSRSVYDIVVALDSAS